MEFTDAVALENTRVTRDGYLLVEAKAARTGIQVYRGAEMGRPQLDTVRVMRPQEEVFSVTSLSSMAHRPVTNNHPKHLVDASNWKSVAVGMTGDKIIRDGEYVHLPFTLMDSTIITEVMNGKRALSMGYTAIIDWTPGETPDGEHYDAVQRNIVGNHLAVVDAARAGPACRIGDSWTSAEPPLATQKEPAMAEPTLRVVMVDGIGITVPDQGAQAIEKLQRQIGDMATAAGRRDAEVTAMRDAHAAALNSAVQAKDGEVAGLKATHASALEAKDGEVAGLKATHQTALDALNGEIAALKAAQPTAEQMDGLIADRANIIDAARKILGDKFDPKGKSNAALRREAVSKRLGATAVADKSDDYIQAAFDTLTAVGAGAPAGRDPVRDHFTAPVNPRFQTSSMQDADDAHAKYVDQLRNGWKASSSTEAN